MARKDPVQAWLPGTAVHAVPIRSRSTDTGSTLSTVVDGGEGNLRALIEQLTLALGQRNITTVRDAMTWAVRNVSPSAAASTRRQYVRHYEALADMFGDLPLSDLGPEHLGKIIERWPGKESRLVVRSVRRAQKLLKRSGLYSGPISFEGVRTTMETRERPLAVQEARLVVEVCRRMLAEGEWAPALYAIMVALLTGARCRSEVLSAEWSWLAQEGRCFWVPAHQTKTRKRRVIALPAASRSLISHMRELALDDRFIFPGKSREGPVSYSACNRAWRMIRERARLPDIRLHDLRHTCGTELAKQGLDIRSIAGILGHVSLASTQVYVHHAGLDQRLEALDVVAESIVGPKK